MKNQDIIFFTDSRDSIEDNTEEVELSVAPRPIEEINYARMTMILTMVLMMKRQILRLLATESNSLNTNSHIPLRLRARRTSVNKRDTKDAILTTKMMLTMTRKTSKAVVIVKGVARSKRRGLMCREAECLRDTQRLITMWRIWTMRNRIAMRKTVQQMMILMMIKRTLNVTPKLPIISAAVVG